LVGAILVNDQLPRSRLQASVFSVVVLSVIRGGPNAIFRGMLYQETLEWADVIRGAFIYCALRGPIAKRARFPPD